MLIKSGEFELEIHENSFVCLEEGKTSHFCEWSCMDPDLQETFRDLKKNLSKLVVNFLRSDNTRNFQALSDKYEENSGSGCDNIGQGS